jgi:hypothetical protein
MAIAIGDWRNEKTFESSEWSKRFSLETKGENYETNHHHKQERAEIPVR